MATVSWAETAPLRALVLGWPTAAVPGDADDGVIHLAELMNGHLVAVVSYVVHPLPGREAELAVYFWGMAVLPERQGRGVGTRLVKRVIADARTRGATVVWADARLTAVAFYERLSAARSGPVERDVISGVDGQRVVFELA